MARLIGIIGILIIVAVTLATLATISIRNEKDAQLLSDVENYRQVVTIINNGNTYDCPGLILLKNAAEKFNDLIETKKINGRWENIDYIASPKGCVSS